MKHIRAATFAAFSAVLLLTSGCTTAGVRNASGRTVTDLRPDEAGRVRGTGPESQDIVVVTDFMARSILAIPEIARAQTPPNIVLEPVLNNTRFPINRDVFLTRLRALLNSRTENRVRFIDRAMMATLERERDLRIAGAVTTTSDPTVVEFRGADYFLTGELQGHSVRADAGTADYVLYSFHLTNARTGEIVWEDMREFKKEGLEDAAYR
jgi:PBP1b-binding outer membrane lipoprotein LpoB